ncbi:hypothetical protein [uncultured Erythrobacter sp.]|nr:hypothetical protein [uncultured Erythrobacter sp.]
MCRARVPKCEICVVSDLCETGPIERDPVD